MNKEETLFLKSLAGPIDKTVAEYNLKEVFTIARRHNVLPLCYENISNTPLFEEKQMKLIQQKIFAVVFSQTKRTANFRKIYRTLAQKGIEPLVLKGIICRNLYGELCDHRPSGDEDILVKKEEYFRLAEILEENGFIPDEKVTKKTLENVQEITFRNANGLNLEVHLNIIGTENKMRQKMNSVFKDCFETSILINIDGQDYRTLGYTEHFTYLFYHMFKHFSMTGVGVRQMLDLFKFGEMYRDLIDWNKVNSAIESIGAGKLYGDVLEIGRTYWGFNFENVFGVSFPDKLLADIFSAGAYGNETSEQMGSKVKVMAAIASEGKNSRLKMLFPSIEAMREHYTILNNHPYLLPVMWIVRIGRYIFRSKTGKTYDVSKSEQIADKKIQLLRDYDII